MTSRDDGVSPREQHLAADARSFYSILYDDPDQEPLEETSNAPECFHDLNLDQIVAALTASREQYNLRPFLHAPLNDRTAILYRQQILQDLEDERVREPIVTFARSMTQMRARLARMQKLRHVLQKQRWLLDAIKAYCDAVNALLTNLVAAAPSSDGLSRFSNYLRKLTRSIEFDTLVKETIDVLAQLSTIEYVITIRGDTVTVGHYAGEVDYSTQVSNIFERFRQGSVKEYHGDLSDDPQMNHVEEHIIERVKTLYPDVFRTLDNYCIKHATFVDDTLARFDREVQVYISYLEYLEPLRVAGLPFCYPDVSATRKDVSVRASFDLVLASKLVCQGLPVVCNDFCLEGEERVIVVSGPNQGGKSTFARVFGQLHYLVRLGLLVPGKDARLFLCDRVFTHFEREEDITAERGKLEDDLLRMHSILTLATPNSVIVLNEIFTSTALRDAITLSKKILIQLIRLDVLCVWVTFIDEVASFGPQTVSMMSTVDPNDSTTRTYKVIRLPASGRAYALSIARRYRLTFESLMERVKP